MAEGQTKGINMAVSEKSRTTEESEIRRLIDTFTRALNAKDVDRIMAVYAPDVRVFDLPPPLQNKGAQTHRRNFAAWFATWRSPIGAEIRELSITTGEDVAFCHFLNRISGTKTDGDEAAYWVRVTLGLRKTDGRWAVVHEHVSVPFYMDGSMRAALDLTP